MRAAKKIDLNCLRSFRPLNRLSDDELDLLAVGTHLGEALKGESLLQIGATDKKTLYLLQGKVCLTAEDGRKSIIDASMPQAKEPISHLVPHHYQVDCLSNVTFIWVENHVLDNLIYRVKRGGESVEDLDVSPQTLVDPLFQDIYSKLADNKLVLPMIPDIAKKLQDYYGRDESTEKIAQLISTDPAIAAHLLRVANSVIFYASRPVDTVKEAIIRIGSKLVMTYVLSYSVKKMFHSHNVHLRKRMVNLWKHSTEVAAISYVLARELPGFDPEHAMLLGLLHDIGMLPIISYAEHDSDFRHDTAGLDEAIRLLHGEVGALIMSQWRFSNDFILVATEADVWFRDATEKADYCDLVMLAQLISFMGKHINEDTPPLDEKALPDSLTDIPAFTKLGFKRSDPDHCFNILADAKLLIDELKQNLMH